MIARRFICFLFNLATPLFVFAANPVMWNVNISTTGEDVFWTSPTAITTGLPEYDYSYEITKLTANVALFGNRDLLGLLDETSGSGTAGAFPFDVVDETLDEPTSGSSADIRIEVDSAGVGHASGTNIELGSILGFPIRRSGFDGHRFHPRHSGGGLRPRRRSGRGRLCGVACQFRIPRQPWRPMATKTTSSMRQIMSSGATTLVSTQRPVLAWRQRA